MDHNGSIYPNSRIGLTYLESSYYFDYVLICTIYFQIHRQVQLRCEITQYKVISQTFLMHLTLNIRETHVHEICTSLQQQ